MPPKNNIIEAYNKSPKGIRITLWKILHGFIQSRDKKHKIRFMNYGYLDDELENNPIQLEEADKGERMCVNMYHQNVSEVNLEGKNVLEVGCGRGGGADYISRYLKPASYIGLDLNKKVVKACNRAYDAPNLSFVQGSADDLPFEDGIFDAITNVESSRGYPDFMGFLNEVMRVLKPGGHLLFSDMRIKEDHPKMVSGFKEAGFNILVEKEIGPHVLKALEIDDERRVAEIEERTKAKFLRKSMKEFSGTVGTETYNFFKEGKYVYYHYVLQKPV